MMLSMKECYFCECMSRLRENPKDEEEIRPIII